MRQPGTERPRGRVVLGSALVLLMVLVTGCGLAGSPDSPSASGSASSTPSGSDAPSHPASASDDSGPATGAPSDTASSQSLPQPPADLARYYHQEVSWEKCGSGNSCATLEVPMDYDHPGGQSIELSLLKVPAGAPDEKIGALVVNPGGPGGSGIAYAKRAVSVFGPEVLDHYAIVGFDPRGVGQSTPVNCLSDTELDDFVAADPDPDTQREIRATQQELDEFAHGCRQHNRALMAHMSTEEVARDMDIIRAVLGQPRLNYFGASYGTFLGATYAGLFPQRVGRMVLDGGIDPTLTTVELNLAQAKGFEAALRDYVTHCVKQQGSCFLGNSVDAGIQRIQDFLAATDRDPLPTNRGRELTEGLAVLGIWAPLYRREYWSLLDQALKAAFSGNGSGLLLLANAYTSRGPQGYRNNSMEALYVVNCLDHPDAVPPGKVASYVDRFTKAAPTFGRLFAWSLTSCAGWPVESERTPHPIHAKGAAPIVVIGTTNDPATPYAWSKALARQLASGVLLTREGEGHTAYNTGNQCINDAVNTYLLTGTPPDPGTRC